MISKSKQRRNNKLQEMCRYYLVRCRKLAKKHGLIQQLNSIIKANRRGECEATEKECEMLSRLCNDERITRTEIPSLFGKSYRQCNDEEIFDKIRKLPRTGVYSKVNATLLADENNNK